MGTRIAVMRDGVLLQQGPPQILYDEPDNLLVASFIGAPVMSLIRGRIERDPAGLVCVLGTERLPVAANGSTAALARYVGADVAVGIRAEHLSEPTGAASGRPRLRGRVRLVERLGPEQLVQLEIEAVPVAADGGTPGSAGTTVIAARFDAHARVLPGDDCEIAVTIERLHFFDLATSRAIRERD